MSARIRRSRYTEAGRIDRRTVLKGGAALLFSAGVTGGVSILPISTAGAQSLWPSARGIDPVRLDTWITVAETGDVTAFFGKMDMGQGVDTAIAQVVAEELDVDVARVDVVMGDTHLTPNQGGASGSSGCRQGSIPLRNAAAEARRVFVERASERLNVPVDRLRTRGGSVYAVDDPGTRITYGELIADGFHRELDWNGQYGNGLLVDGGAGSAGRKAPRDYAVIGTPVARKDIPGKVLATTEYCHHVTLPGMLHGRAVRPPVANAVPIAADERSIAHLSGARAVHVGDFVAVVAEREWDAINAARALAVEWSETRAPFPSMDRLYDHIRGAPAVADNSVANFGPRRPYDPQPSLDAIAASATVIEAEYELPFQSHARMAPSIGVADVRDGEALVFSDTQKPHDTRNGIARLLDLPPERVRVVWKPGSGSYGRSDADEAAYEAAVLSREVGRPVRVQWMRDEGHAWDPKAPAAVITCKAGLDDAGQLSAWYFRAKGFSGWDVMFNASDPKDTLVGQLLGWQKGDAHNFGVPGESYAFPNAVKFWETIAPLQERASPLRCAHMRAPQEPQLHFAQECFLDEVAARAGIDPIELRLSLLTNEREIEVLRAVQALSGWQTRPSPRADVTGDVVTGRGVAINSGYGAHVATVCEVEVDRRSGRIWAKRFFVAHDCGLVINPKGLVATIEGNIVQGVSRTFEEVRFDERAVQSVDWASYPILDVTDAPERIDVVTIDRPELPPGGAGEPAHVTVPAAIGNAVFDATGVRLRRLPLRLS